MAAAGGLSLPNDAPDLSQVRRALVVKLRHHGDVLLTSPVFDLLKHRAPHIEIDALVYSDTAEMLTLHPAVSQVHGVDRQWKKRGPIGHAAAELGLWRRLRARRYDLLLHLTENRRGIWWARTLGPKIAVAPKLADADSMWEESFTHFYALPRLGNSRHTAEVNLDALRRIGLMPAEDEKHLTLIAGPQAEESVAAHLAAHELGEHGYIHLHPTSRWMFKTWPAENVAALIDRLAELGQRVVLTAAPSSVEMAMIERILAFTRAAPANLAGKLTLKELAALTARARLFIGVDSAPMHIAASQGTPTVALFGPSGDIEWGPWRVAHRVVASQIHPCRPCGNDGCGGSKVSECLTTLPVERVLEAAQELLGTAN
ncbi:MAG TPA: putative lipopolysaccharide heptosyltransferase III [Burkholderiales bacterium]|jgi:heptosyltransferase-3